MDFEIAVARPQDCAALVPLFRAVQALHVAAHPDLFRTGASDGEMAGLLRQMTETGTTLIARRDDAPVGFLTYEIREQNDGAIFRAGREAELHHISIDPTLRRAGIGRALVAEMRTRLADAGVTHIRATHYAFNAESPAFLRGIGLASLKTVMRGPV